MKTCILAIDAGGTFLKSALIAGGEIIPGTGRKVGVDSDLGTADEVHAAYSRLIKEEALLAASLGLTFGKVSVDTPGPFDYKTGTPLMTHKYRAIYGISLIPWIREAVGDLPITFVHDSAAFITGAFAWRRDIYSAAGVMIGTGLGFALSKGGRPLLANTGSPLVSIFKAPYRDGIAEDYISAGGILKRYNAKAPSAAENAKEIAERAALGDNAALEAYAETGAMLAEIIAPILSEHGTEALAVGGQIARSFDLFGEELRQGLGSLGVCIPVFPASDIDGVHLLGAARCADEGLFVY
ncbi:MAG: ROK family protein [Clostridia bacterium]|nr:ROK family protein [Clostridia bacterium]